MSILILIPAAIAGIVPMLIAVTVIYWLDRYEREPWWLVALVFLWGAIGGTGFGCFCNSTIIAGVDTVLGADAANWIGPVIVAPLVEEVTKIIPLFALIFLRHFDNATDGLIYGAAAGLGFAMTENIMYFYQVGSSAGFLAMVTNILIRTLFTAQVHFAASACWGFVLGLARYRHPALRWLVAPPVGYAAAVTIHAFWNGSATYSSLNGALDVQAGACVLITCIGAFVLALAQLSLFMEHRVIKAELLAEASDGTLPLAHADIIPYWLKRVSSDWAPPGVDKNAYARAATLLAFRRHQARHASGDIAEQLEGEVRKYRHEVKLLLQRASPTHGAPPPAGGPPPGGRWGH
ncbi:MAG: hypothetical protein CMH57_03505 [Myxococcales bacterium]|nr:hypothetical protein [Myxococcales bacterium]